MKNLILLLFPVICFGQVKDVKLENNTLYKKQGNEWIAAGSVIGGTGSTPTLIYDELYGSYYSIGSTQVAHPGQFNVGIGVGTFEFATTANYNIHIGQRAGWKTTVAKNNVFIGWEAGRENSFGVDNVGISEDALLNNIRGAGNVAIGRGTMINNISGPKNTALGYNSLQALVGGEGNTAVGAYSMAWMGKTSSNNTSLGYYALETNNDQIVVNNSIGIGYQAGISNPFSDVILIGTNVKTTKNGGINIGNVYKGDVTTGNAEVNSISISGRKVTFDDNFMYVTTSTGLVKKVALQDISPAQPTGFKVYNAQGQLLFYQPIYKN